MYKLDGLTSFVPPLAQCAGWMKANQKDANILQPCMQFVTHFLDHPSIHLVGHAAADAVRRICLPCQEFLVPFLRPSVDRYLACFSAMRPEDRHLVVQGLVSVAYRIDDLDQICAALFSISKPTVALLKAQMTTLERDELIQELRTLAAVMSSPPDNVIVHLLVSNPQKQHPVVTFLQYGDIWQVLQSIQESRGGEAESSSDEEIMSELYETYANIVRTARKHAAIMLSSLFDRIAAYFVHVRPTACALSLCTTIICAFYSISVISLLLTKVNFSANVLKDDASLAPFFNQFIANLAQHVLSRIEKLDTYIVAAFLEMAATALSVNAQVLLQPQQAQQAQASDSTSLVRILFQLSVRVLLHQNTLSQSIGAPISESVQTALQFLESFLFGSHVQQSADWQNFVIASLNSGGPDLVRGLLRAATIPGVHKQVSQLLFELLKGYREAMKALILDVIQHDTETLPTDLFPADSRQAIAEAFFTLQNPRRFTSFIKDLSEVCNLRAEKDVLLAYLM